MSPGVNEAPVIINMAAAQRAVVGKLLVGWLLSPYRADPHAIVRELRGPWHLVGDVTPQRIPSDDERFILNFEAEGDMLHVLRAGPWHYRNDAVIFAAFNGKGNACDVELDVIQVWAQIHGLPYELKSVEMGWELGKKLGKVVGRRPQEEDDR